MWQLKERELDCLKRCVLLIVAVEIEEVSKGSRNVLVHLALSVTGMYTTVSTVSDVYRIEQCQTECWVFGRPSRCNCCSGLTITAWNIPYAKYIVELCNTRFSRLYTCCGNTVCCTFHFSWSRVSFLLLHSEHRAVHSNASRLCFHLLPRPLQVFLTVSASTCIVLLQLSLNLALLHVSCLSTVIIYCAARTTFNP
jgi:hypothetical protein